MESNLPSPAEMADNNPQPEQLQLLQLGHRLNLLDRTNKVRSWLNRQVSMPQIIVCGDQSSGKTSTLEAISGLPLPIKDNLCTRFATELVLQPAPTASVSVTVVPSPTRTAADRKWLLDFRPAAENLQGLHELIDKAKEAMNLTTSFGAIHDDVLRIESSGPNLPHLTLVDLPGLIQSENKAQSAADVTLIARIVRRYMENPRSIILAVVSAANGFGNQVVLKLAKQADPFGRRTLGLITKPDTLPPGSETERAFVALARNENVEFGLGWHVLRNRAYETRESSTEARDVDEAHFFRHGIWASLPRDLVGIDTLRVKLSEVRLEHVDAEPSTFVETSPEKDPSATGENWHEVSPQPPIISFQFKSNTPRALTPLTARTKSRPQRSRFHRRRQERHKRHPAPCGDYFWVADWSVSGGTRPSAARGKRGSGKV